MNFLGVKVIPMCKHYLNTKNESLIVEICIFLSQIARDHSQFNNEILGVQIIRRFSQWLTDEAYNEQVK